MVIQSSAWRKKYITPEMCKKMFNLKEQQGLNYTELDRRFGFSAAAVSKALKTKKK